MKAECPKCGFSGNIADNLIPEEGRMVGCPKCKERFFINKLQKVKEIHRASEEFHSSKITESKDVVDTKNIHELIRQALEDAESENLDRMLSAVRYIPMEGYGLTRHFLLLHIVEQTHRNRDNRQMRSLCKHYSIQHIMEIPYYVKLMDAETKKLDGEAYRYEVSTFQHLAAIYMEEGNFKAAIKVCEQAIKYRIPDRTKSGYEGRIERIKKKMQKSS